MSLLLADTAKLRGFAQGGLEERFADLRVAAREVYPEAGHERRLRYVAGGA